MIYSFNILQISKICTFKHNVKMLVDYENYSKSYTSLKFWLKNVLSLWSWALFWHETYCVCCPIWSTVPPGHLLWNGSTLDFIKPLSLISFALWNTLDDVKLIFHYRLNMAGILQIQRKTHNNQSTWQRAKILNWRFKNMETWTNLDLDLRLHIHIL